MNNPTVLFLDDCPFRSKYFRREFPFATMRETARGIVEAIKAEKQVDWLFLDHDLDGLTYVDPNEPNTGMEVVRWIVKNRPQIKWIIIHSFNHDAARLMESTLLEAGYCAMRQPFARFSPMGLDELERKMCMDSSSG